MSTVDLMTPGEVAKAFKVDPKTVSRWAQAGRLPSLKTPGGIYRFHRADVEALLADPEVAPTFVPGCHGTLFRYEGGVKVGAAWGPAADRSGEWFVYRDDVNDRETVRVPSREAAVAYLEKVVIPDER